MENPPLVKYEATFGTRVKDIFHIFACRVIYLLLLGNYIESAVPCCKML